MFDTLISDLRNTTKPANKLKIFLKCEETFLKNILKYTLDSFYLFHVKIDPVDIQTTGDKTVNDTLVQKEILLLLDACRNNNSNKQNRIKVLEYLNTLNKGSQELLYSIINKDWKAGVSKRAIRKAYPGLINSFEVQLSEKYLEIKKQKTYKAKNRYCSFKLDGIRCIFLRMFGEWKAYSRQGKEFLTVDHLKPQLELLYNKNGKSFWDGELYIDNAPFEYIQGRAMSFTKGTSDDLDFRAFICGDSGSFLQCMYKDFLIVTEDLLDINAPQIKFLEQKLITEEEIDTELEKAFSLGYEGIMLRDPDQLYDFKRSSALMKLKESDAADSQEQIEDCLVQDLIFDDVTVVIDGKMVFVKLLTKLIVLQKNNILCTVGSGFDLKFRYHYTEHPEEILNKVVEIKFQQYGAKGRMRFPRYFRIREDLTWGE